MFSTAATKSTSFSGFAQRRPDYLGGGWKLTLMVGSLGCLTMALGATIHIDRER